MRELQQYTCPVCGAVGANTKESYVPLCHRCPNPLPYMQKSHNGVIKELRSKICSLN